MSPRLSKEEPRPSSVFRRLARFALISVLVFITDAKATPPLRDQGLECNGLYQDSQDVQTSGRWTPQLDSTRGRVELLMSILKRHPNFVTANLNFRRNVLEAFSHIPDVITMLGTHAQSLEIVPPQVLSASYVSKGLKYSDQRLNSFRQARIQDLQSLDLAAQDLSHELRRFKNNKKMKTLLRMLPFLFDSDGKPQFTKWDETTRERLTADIQKSGPADWENGYFDLLPRHLEVLILSVASEPGMEALQQDYQSFKNQFLANEVRQIIHPTVSTQQVSELSIEEIPGEVPCGAYGGDCSILSVPYYRLLKGVKGYFIRKSKDLNTQPAGYALAAKVKIGSGSNAQFIPYVLTINGATLSQADVQVAADLVRQSDPDYAQSKTMAFPDWSTDAKVVNWDHSRKAMTVSHGRKMRVQMPDGWNKAVEFHNLNNRKGYTNYYGRDSIQEPVVGEFVPKVQLIGEIENTRLLQVSYPNPERIEKLPPIERAIVAGQALEDSNSDQYKQELLKVLQVNDSQVQAASPLLKLSPSQGLTLTQYRALERQFGFEVQHILAFEPETRTKVLSNLYEESPDLFREHNARDNSKVRDALINYYGGKTYQALIESLWDHREVSDQILTQFLKQSVTNKVDDYIHLSQPLSSSRSSYIAEFLAWAYLASVANDASLSRGLSYLFQSEDASIQAFKEAVIRQATQHTYYQKRYPILAIYLDVASRMKPQEDLYDAFEAWVRDPSVRPARKADFIMTLIGRGQGFFDRYMNEIKTSELSEFWTRMDQRTCFRVYYNLAKEKNLTAFVLDHATLETFLLSSEGMPALGQPVTFQMGDDQYGPIHQVTLTRPIQVAVAPETDIQWELIMGTNPSKFAGAPEPQQHSMSVSRMDSWLGFRSSQNPAQSMNSSNRPVGNITWWSAAEYLNRRSKLEGLEPVFDFSNVTFTGRAEDGTLVGKGEVIIRNANGYRFGTEAEQEYFVRGGTTTKYPTGDDESKLPLVAQFKNNSGGKTQPIGQLRPNAYGLVDTSGNVWEWGMDLHGDYPSEPVTDPIGLSAGSVRVIRGGSWYFNARSLRSALRSSGDPGEHYDGVGFRAVRAAQPNPFLF